MMDALLLETDGTHRVVSVEWSPQHPGAYIKAVSTLLGAHMIERVPCLDGYLCQSSDIGISHRRCTKREYRFLSCYVDEEGVLEGRPSNPHQPLIAALGMSFSAQLGLHGPLLLLSTNVDATEQQDSSIDPYIVQLFDRYALLDDGVARNEFLSAVM